MADDGRENKGRWMPLVEWLAERGERWNPSTHEDDPFGPLLSQLGASGQDDKGLWTDHPVLADLVRDFRRGEVETRLVRILNRPGDRRPLGEVHPLTSEDWLADGIIVFDRDLGVALNLGAAVRDRPGDPNPWHWRVELLATSVLHEALELLGPKLEGSDRVQREVTVSIMRWVVTTGASTNDRIDWTWVAADAARRAGVEVVDIDESGHRTLKCDGTRVEQRAIEKWAKRRIDPIVDALRSGT